MLITISEIIGMIIVTLVIGYIFMDFFQIRRKSIYSLMHPQKFDMGAFKLSAIVTAPAVILHELGHKFVAILFGFPAEFHMWTFGLILAVFLKVIHSPLLIIAPGYVIIPSVTDPIIYRLIAFAGPLVNLILWGLSSLALKSNRFTKKQILGFFISKKINMILFIFNMIPFGPLDGAKVFFGP